MRPYDPYKTARELGITDEERQGLIKLARALPYDTDAFAMSDWRTCICGRLYKSRALPFVSKLKFSAALTGLFCMWRGGNPAPCWMPLTMNHSKEQAATAITRFLTNCA
ncbi:MAG: hypothetical protein ACREC4_04855 [Methylocella sp.]